MGEKFQTVDAYIQSFPEEVQPLLEQVRQAIRRAAPQADEVISYNIPAYKLQGKTVIHFGGAKKHIGMYPYYDSMNAAFPEAQAYAQSGKGTIRFPLDQPLPLELIESIVKLKLKMMADAAD